MKKIVALILTVMMVAVLGLSVSAEELPATAPVPATITATPAKASVKPGDTFKVDFVVANNTGVMGLVAKAPVVDAALEEVKAANGTLFASAPTGTASLVWISAETVKDGVLYTVEGKVPATAAYGTEYKFIMEVELASDADENEVVFTAVEGKIVVTCDHAEKVTSGAIAATCETAGYTGDTYCKACNKLLEAGKEIAALGHKGGKATCSKKAVCEVCAKEYGELDANNHVNVQETGAVAATCTTAGKTADKVCKDCGKKIAEGKEIAALGHKGGTATCSKKAICTVCGQAYGELDANKHGETELKGAVEATTTKEGYTGDTCCKDCGKVLVKGSAIAKIINPPTADNGVITVCVLAFLGIAAVSGVVLYKKRREF